MCSFRECIFLLWNEGPSKKNCRGKQNMNYHYTSGLPYIRDDEKSIFTLGHRTPFGMFTFWLCPYYYTFGFLWFTNCVLLYDKYSNTRMLVTFGICFEQLFDTRYLVFCNLSPPRMFCPWIFFQNIGFNIVPSDPFMSHLATQLGNSAGEFQALQLTVLAAFGVVD